MDELSLQTDRYTGWIRGAIEGMKDASEGGGLDMSDILQFKRLVLEAADGLDSKLRDVAPALHLIFDDHQNEASLIATPALNVRIGEEVHKISWITEADLKIPEIRRGLGRPLSTWVACSFEMSRLLKEAGHEGMTFICEIEDDDIHMLAAPFDTQTRHEEPMLS